MITRDLIGINSGIRSGGITSVGHREFDVCLFTSYPILLLEEETYSTRFFLSPIRCLCIERQGSARLIVRAFRNCFLFYQSMDVLLPSRGTRSLSLSLSTFLVHARNGGLSLGTAAQKRANCTIKEEGVGMGIIDKPFNWQSIFECVYLA